MPPAHREVKKLNCPSFISALRKQCEARRCMEEEKLKIHNWESTFYIILIKPLIVRESHAKYHVFNCPSFFQKVIDINLVSMN